VTSVAGVRVSRYLLALAVSSAATAAAQAPNPEVERHIAAARAAAGEHASMVDRLCPAPGVARPVQGNRTAPQGTPPRESWHAEPAKVFDNFYFVGMTEFSAWAVTTSEGIIVIDPLFDYSVEDEVVDGLRKLGQIPRTSRTCSSATATSITSAARSFCRSASARACC
jgi:metallo-beta-lactamase class B